MIFESKQLALHTLLLGLFGTNTNRVFRKMATAEPFRLGCRGVVVFAKDFDSYLVVHFLYGLLRRRPRHYTNCIINYTTARI